MWNKNPDFLEGWKTIPVTLPSTQPDVLYLSQLAEVSAAESVGYHNNESKIMCHCYSQFHNDGNILQKSAQIRKHLQESYRLLPPSNSKRFAQYKADTGKWHYNITHWILVLNQCFSTHKLSVKLLGSPIKSVINFLKNSYSLQLLTFAYILKCTKEKNETAL